LWSNAERSVMRIACILILFLLSGCIGAQVVAEAPARAGELLIVSGDKTSSPYQVFLSNSGEELRIDNAVPLHSFWVQVIKADGTMKLNTWVWKPGGTTVMDVHHLEPGFYQMRIVSLQDIQFNKLTIF
jgi:hypothetical protein